MFAAGVANGEGLPSISNVVFMGLCVCVSVCVGLCVCERETDTETTLLCQPYRQQRGSPKYLICDLHGCVRVCAGAGVGVDVCVCEREMILCGGYDL